MSGGDDDDRLRELGKQLPWQAPDDASRGAVREALLEAAARERNRPRGRWGFVVGAFGVGALAAAAAMIWLAHAPTRAPEPALSTPVAVEPVPVPVPAPVPAPAPAPPKLVRVHTGALHVGASEHVQLATSDATVDGSADYDVVVAGDALRSVAVHSGKVALRVHGQQEVFLGAGDTWKPKPIVAREAEEIEPTTSMATSRSPSTSDAQKLTESHFESGWQLMKAGKYDDAARELALAADAGGPLAGDARYFEAEALTKAGHAPEAERALLAFLDASPKSLRRGRASVMLARLIAARGDAKDARAWFESALHDADPDVVAAANAGLATLH